MSNNHAIFTLGGITFNDGVVDSDGLRWFLSVDGLDSPPVEATLEPRRGMGAHLTSSMWQPRLLKLTGNVESEDYDGLKVARDRWTAALNLVDDAGLLEVDEATDTQVEVWLNERPTWLPASEHHRTLADLTAGLIAPDPRRYSATEHSLALPGSAVNAGSIKSHPRLEVAGATAGTAILTIAGETAVALDLAAGGALVVDLYDRTITLDGAPIFPVDMATSRWPALVPGSSTASWTGGGAATLYWRDAW